MAWLKLGLVLFAVFGNISAQQGYNYERPQRPFEPTRYQTGQQQSNSPAIPTITSNGYQTAPKQNGGFAPRPSPAGQKTATISTGSSLRGSGGFPESPTVSGYQRPILEGGPKTDTTPTGYPGLSSTNGGYPASVTGFGYQSNGIPQGPRTTPTGSSLPVNGDYPESPRVSGYQRPNGVLVQKPTTTSTGYPGSSLPVNGGYAESPTASGYQRPILEGGQKTATGYPGSTSTTGGYPESPTGLGYQKSNGRTTPTGGSSFPVSGGYPDVSSQQPGQKLGNIFQTPSFRPYPGQQNGNFTPFGQTPLPVGSIIGPFVNGQQEEIDEGDYSAIPGEPGQDYPIYSEIPATSFSCDDQQYPGYYADVETRCQVFHICANNKTYDFLCPNGTVFHQEYLVCVWWNQFDCSTAPSLYSINANIYDYTIMGIYQDGIQRYPEQGLVSSSGSTGLTQPSGYPGSTQDNGAIFPTPNRGYPAQRRPGDNQGLISPPSGAVPGANLPTGTGISQPSGYPGSTQANSAILTVPNRGYPAQGSPGKNQGLNSPPSSAIPVANLPGGTDLTQQSGYPGSTQANGATLPTPNKGYPAQRRPGDDQGLISPPSGYPGSSQANGAILPTPNRGYPAQKGPGDYQGLISPPSNAVPGANLPGGTGGFLARPGGYSTVSEGYPMKQQPGNYQENGAISGERQQGGLQLPKGPGSYSTKPQPDYQGVTSQQLNGYPGIALAKQPGGSVTQQQQRPSKNGAVSGLPQNGGTELSQRPNEYPGTIQGYPREQPLIPFPGTKSQQPNREYLPPANGK